MEPLEIENSLNSNIMNLLKFTNKTNALINHKFSDKLINIYGYQRSCYA